jgi:hypothetical protein
LQGIIKHSQGMIHEGCIDLSKAGELGHEASYTVIGDYCNN